MHHLLSVDVLKIGGPYAELTFLNASSVNKRIGEVRLIRNSILELL